MVGESAVGGRICLLKPAKSLNLQHGNSQLFARFLICADKQNWQKTSAEVLGSVLFEVHGRIDSTVSIFKWFICRVSIFTPRR